MSEYSTISFEAVLDEEELICRAAWLYYREKLTQEEIGDRLGISRIKVSRLIERGHKLGLIQVQINSRFQHCLKLESALTEHYALSQAIVTPTGDEANLNENLSFAAAKYLSSQLQLSSLLAIGWGDTVSRALHKLAYSLADANVSLISLTGGVSSYLQSLGSFQTHSSPQRKLHLIPAPILASTEEVARALQQEPQVREVLAMLQTADCALVGVGAVADSATLVTTGYVKPEEILLYERQGAVGDILGQFYDCEGKLLNLPLHKRVTGVGIETLRHIPNVVGVAGGPNKVEAIRGALKGHRLDVLITDEKTARALVMENAR